MSKRTRRLLAELQGLLQDDATPDLAMQIAVAELAASACVLCVRPPTPERYARIRSAIEPHLRDLSKQDRERLPAEAAAGVRSCSAPGDTEVRLAALRTLLDDLALTPTPTT